MQHEALRIAVILANRLCGMRQKVTSSFSFLSCFEERENNHAE
jgi:hypothetical protein